MVQANIEKVGFIDVVLLQGVGNADAQAIADGGFLIV